MPARNISQKKTQSEPCADVCALAGVRVYSLYMYKVYLYVYSYVYCMDVGVSAYVSLCVCVDAVFEGVARNWLFPLFYYSCPVRPPKPAYQTWHLFEPHAPLQGPTFFGSSFFEGGIRDERVHENLNLLDGVNPIVNFGGVRDL